MFRLFSFAFAALVILTACSHGVYKTYYHYEPPEAARGKMCLPLCQKELARCQSQQKNKIDSCLNNEITLQQANALGITAQEICQKGTDMCKRDYRICYEMCGGQVVEKKKCVKNCK